jgi:hypothetical protein
LGNLSNIELFNNKYLDRTPIIPIIPTLPNDQLIVERVEYDMIEILEHADVLYKKDKKGFKPYHYKCKHCETKVTRSIDQFVLHLDLCEGLDDD